ncbi:hypothetical protein KC865_04265 [Candidatus Kaiserbacteria bacterium]|nr:hypothetical protein [Candidatus Kaiserbacteria bacterium]USN92536.1 MAG: hypothetical protein H6782_01840 [Candidatus Nomurabacteria bacterium]
MTFKSVSEPLPVPIAEPKKEVITVKPTPTSTRTIIGRSAQNREISALTFGTGETNILLVGGIHGGYEWNSVVLAYEMIDYFETNPIAIPEEVTVHIIPNLNPDGLFLATGLQGKFSASDIPNNDMHNSGVGRFNANDVDINRNFDCRWAESGVWRGKEVSAGSAPFSEPEAVALRDYVNSIKPKATIFWHSKAGNVYGSECGGEVADKTLTLMRTYANASGYGQVPVFDAYVVTGAAEDWLASLGIPTVSVELTSRTDSEYEQNLAGVKAVLDLYGK